VVGIILCCVASAFSRIQFWSNDLFCVFNWIWYKLWSDCLCGCIVFLFFIFVLEVAVFFYLLRNQISCVKNPNKFVPSSHMFAPSYVLEPLYLSNRTFQMEGGKGNAMLIQSAVVCKVLFDTTAPLLLIITIKLREFWSSGTL